MKFDKVAGCFILFHTENDVSRWQYEIQKKYTVSALKNHGQRINLRGFAMWFQVAKLGQWILRTLDISPKGEMNIRSPKKNFCVFSYWDFCFFFFSCSAIKMVILEVVHGLMGWPWLQLTILRGHSTTARPFPGRRSKLHPRHHRRQASELRQRVGQRSCGCKIGGLKTRTSMMNMFFWIQ